MSERDHKQDRSKPAEPRSPEAPRSDGRARGVAGVLAARQDAVDMFRYRLTGGAEGVGPDGSALSTWMTEQRDRIRPESFFSSPQESPRFPRGWRASGKKKTVNIDNAKLLRNLQSV